MQGSDRGRFSLETHIKNPATLNSGYYLLLLWGFKMLLKVQVVCVLIEFLILTFYFSRETYEANISVKF